MYEIYFWSCAFSASYSSYFIVNANSIIFGNANIPKLRMFLTTLTKSIDF